MALLAGAREGDAHPAGHPRPCAAGAVASPPLRRGEPAGGAQKEPLADSECHDFSRSRLDGKGVTVDWQPIENPFIQGTPLRALNSRA
jgi:hypothetical protein